MDTEILQNLHDKLAGELISLADKRASLADLKTERTQAAKSLGKAFVSATIAGVTFDQADELRAAREEIGIIDEALAEIDRDDDRLRPQLRKVQQHLDVQSKGADMMALAERIYDGLAAAQKAGETMVEALAEVYELSRDIGKIDGDLNRMKGELGTSSVFDAAFLNRLGERMGRLLNTVHRGSLGQLRWQLEQDRTTPEVWADDEWKIMSSHAVGQVARVRSTLDAVESEKPDEQESIDAEGDGRDDDENTGDE